MHILENFGIEVMSPRALSLFEKAGAKVDHATQNVRIDRGLVAEALKTTPSHYTLTPRNPERTIHLGGDTINFTLVAGPPNVHDMERGRRAGNLRDYSDLVRLAQHFNCIHMIGNQVCAPVELPANSRHLDTYFANLTLTDKSFPRLGDRPGQGARRHRHDGDRARADARPDCADDPGVTTIISVNSPRRFDDMMAEGLMTMAEHGQSVAVTPFTLMGAMSPVTLAGALAQQNAEALFGVVLTQLVRPGAPVMYGAFTSNVDMKSGAPAFGTPENTKANVASGQLARRYYLPYRTTPGSASNAADAQGAYETHDGAVGRGARPRQPRLPRRRLAGGRADRVVREVHHRRRDDPAHDGVPDARSRSTRANWRSMRSAACRPAAISSASRTRWSAIRPPSTSRCCPTGRTTKPGRKPAASTPPRARRGCGRRRWRNMSSRRWMLASARSSRRMWRSGKEEIGEGEP